MTGTKRQKGQGQPVLLRHLGHSMHPTLKQFEALRVEPCDFAEIRVGDVIAFRFSDSADAIAHRVVARASGGLQTAGDNFPSPDPWLVRPENIIGRVSRALDGRGERRVAGSFFGLAVGRLRHLRRGALAGGRRLLRPLRGGASHFGRGFLRWLPDALRPTLVDMSAGGRRRFRLVLGGRVIGRWDDRDRAWKIRPGFRFLCDGLPSPQGHRR